MDKENNEILKEEQSLNDSVLDSDRKIINVINFQQVVSLLNLGLNY